MHPPCTGSDQPRRGIPWRRRGPWLLVLVVVLAYANSLSAPFLFDDGAAIVENPTIRQLWPLPGPLRTPPGSAACGRPVVNITLAVNYALGGLQVTGYRLVNTGLHALAACVLFGLLRRTLGGRQLGPRWGPNSRSLALAVAAIWAVHPLQTSTVTYLIQRTELLMGLLMLATLYCFVRGAENGHRRGWLAAGVACCALGMGSKEVMVGAPVLVLLYDRMFLAGSVRAAWQRRWPWYLALAATWLILASLVVSTSFGVKTGVGFTSLNPWEYALTQCGVIVHYLRLSFWPYPLVFDYLDWAGPRLSAQLIGAVITVIALAAATGWALWRRYPWGYLGAWFLVVLAPTSSFLPLHGEVVAERRMYLPLAAVLVLAILGGHAVLRRLAARAGGGRRTRQLGTILTVILVGVGATGTAWRNLDYRSAVAIWSDTVAKRPGNYRAYTDLGVALAEEGLLEEAMACYRQALRIAPNYAMAHTNLGVALAQQGNLMAALQEFAAAVRLRPDSAQAQYNLGLALARLGDTERAVWHWQQALRRNPHFAPARDRLQEQEQPPATPLPLEN